MYPVLVGSLPFVGPAFDTARQDISRQYPKLNISQNFLQSGRQYRTCTEWATDSADALAFFYYQMQAVSGSTFDVTVFVLPGNKFFHLRGKEYYWLQILHVL